MAEDKYNNIDPNEGGYKKEVFVPVEAPKVNPMMIVRTIVFVVALVNAGLALFGSSVHIELDQGAIYEGVSYLFLIASGAWSWYKNNDISKIARKRQEVNKQVGLTKDKDKQ